MRGMFPLNRGRRWRRVAWALVFWVLVPVALPVVEAVDAALSPGIFDDADDDSLIATLSSLDLQLTAPMPPPPPNVPWLVGGPAPAETDRRALSVAVVPIASRSPPPA